MSKTLVNPERPPTGAALVLAIADRPLLRIVVLCILYCAQGIPHGFVTYALVAWLLEQGAGVKEVAIIATMSTLPWSFKWGWGPVVDRFQIRRFGKRRPWIIFAQVMMILTALMFLSVPDPVQAIWALGYVVLIHNIFSGLQDVSVDALAVDLLRPEERGRANGLMYGSKYGGVAIGAALLGSILATSGLTAAVFALVILLCGIMCFPIFIRERKSEQLFPFGSRASGHLVSEKAEAEEGSENPSVMQLATRLLRAFGRRNTIAAACLGLLIWLPSGIVYPIGMDLFIGDLGWTQEDYTSLTGTWGVGAGLFCSVMGGFLADLVGARRLAAAASVLLGGLLAMFALVPDELWMNTTFVSIYLVAEQGAQGLLSVSLFAMFMSVSWKVVAATQFTAYMSLLNLSHTIGTAVSPFTETFGVRNVFILAAIMQVLIIAILPRCTPWKDRSDRTQTSGMTAGT